MKLYSTVPIIEGVMQNIGNPTLLEMNFIYWDYKEESKFFVIPVYWEYKEFTLFIPIPPLLGVQNIVYFL